MNKLAAAYVKCIKIFFGYSKFSSVTAMLVELGLPSFSTVLHNAAASFNRSLGCSANRLVTYVCNCSSYSVVPASLELFFCSLVIFFRQFVPEQRPAFIAMTCFKAWCAGTLVSSMTFLVDYVSNVRQASCISYVDVLHVKIYVAYRYRGSKWNCHYFLNFCLRKMQVCNVHALVYNFWCLMHIYRRIYDTFEWRP